MSAVDQDMLTKLVAADLGMPYEKPDPLKLDADLITSVMKPRVSTMRPLCSKGGLK